MDMFLQRPYAQCCSWVEEKITAFYQLVQQTVEMFLLNPPTEIYDLFLNLSSSKYAFVGVENKELIFLNDLRWSQEMIPWQELLNLPEGQSVHLVAPKTHYARETLITDDVPIFATSRSSSCLFIFHCLNRKLSRATQDASVNLCSWELMRKALSQLLSPFWF